MDRSQGTDPMLVRVFIRDKCQGQEKCQNGQHETKDDAQTYVKPDFNGSRRKYLGIVRYKEGPDTAQD